MTSFEIYSLIICLIVYVLLAGLGIFMLITVLNLTLKLIRSGANDKEILDEYEKSQGKQKRSVFDWIFSGLLIFVVLVVFVFSAYVGCTKNVYFESTPTFKVVNSSSMSFKNEKNQYLFDNELDNQFNTFDLILTYELPKEEDLKLYDIVIYEIDGILVIHRIVRIEEPNERHPNERWFLLQGDAISQPDRFPVKYEQMKGIYRNEKIPFVGSFIAFMQSPAGYMCMILVALAIVFTPIMEKKINKETQIRLDLMLAKQLEEQAGQEVGVSAFAHLEGKKDDRTFDERLSELPIAKDRYEDIYSLVKTISGVRTIDSKKNRTFKSGNYALVRFAVKGKTLNAYLGLEPSEYENTKYVFTDVSGVKKYENYPMRVKITSDRQTRWVKELLTDLVNKRGLTFVEGQEIPESVSPFAHLEGRKDDRTFDERLSELPVAKDRYEDIYSLVKTISGVRTIDSKKNRTFKSGNNAIVRFAVKGKTLNAYLGLEPSEYENTKYIFTDVSSVKKYENYPMRVKLTSERQLRWVKELLIDKVNKSSLSIATEKEVVETLSPFAHLKGKKNSKTFNQKLKLSPVAKARYLDIKAYLETINGVRVIESKSQITYKKGNNPIVRFAVKGKTLNAYLGLTPNEYENTKYIFTDVSAVKKYENYPMRVKLTSDRQVKWTKELIAQILEKGDKI